MFDAHSSAFSTGELRRALECMKSRGPDSEGIWAENGTSLGHRRLAIVDLDHRSDQPMHSVCGRYAIVFNGEVYNYQDLSAELIADGVVLFTKSDTEVLLALFAREGEAMLPRLRGMFAFVIWDKVSRRAFAARDPYGIKPLYWAQLSGGVILASQVRAIQATGLVSRMGSPRGQAGFWLLGSVPEPFTWYEHIFALPAGHSTWIIGGRLSEPKLWWNIASVWRDTSSTRMPRPFVQESVRSAVRASVAAHLVADVPVGIFLSGGIDSAALAGLMIDAGATNLQGVTVAYDEFAGSPRDEAPTAALVASHYNIKHHVRRVTCDEFERDLPRILAAMDQPSVDGINTWYASKAVAELGLKVVVSGVGGDELFQGYSHFRTLPYLVSTWSGASLLPGVKSLARSIMKRVAERRGDGRWNQAPDWAMSIEGAWCLRRGLFSLADLPFLMGPELAAAGLRGFNPNDMVAAVCGTLSTNSAMALSQIESTFYLRNQLLRDSDWASMDHSVELRTPLVDAWLIQELQPLLSEFHKFPNKMLLATAPSRPLPQAVMRRPKTGFGIPIQKWLGRRAEESAGGHSRSWAREIGRAYTDSVGQ